MTTAMQILRVEKRLLHTAIRVQKGTHIFYTQQDPDRLCSEYRFLNRGVYKSRYRSAENLRQGSGATLRSRVCFAGRNLAAMLRTPALRPLLHKALAHGALTRRVQKRAIYHGGKAATVLRRICGREAGRHYEAVYVSRGETLPQCYELPRFVLCYTKHSRTEHSPEGCKKERYTTGVYRSFWCSCGESNSGHLD